ncbi:MAG: hypothetical protein ACUVYA_11060 [Planctomycetota bacterium]
MGNDFHPEGTLAGSPPLRRRLSGGATEGANGIRLLKPATF